MILYLMRHANAGLRRPNPSLDAKRALVKDGKDQCVLMARTLSAYKVQIDTVVSSPLKRAQQTAQFVATELGHEAKVEIRPKCKSSREESSDKQSLFPMAIT